MKIWIGGEIDSIIDDSFRIIRNYLEQKINEMLSINDYGNGVLNWDVIIIISQKRGKNVYKYNKKNRETDVRQVLDFDEFLNADNLTKKIILLDSLILSLENLLPLEIVQFDSLRLKTDLLNLKNVISSTCKLI